jgi:hypothetical protein
MAAPQCITLQEARVCNAACWQVTLVANACCNGRVVSVLEGGYGTYGAFLAHARSHACPHPTVESYAWASAEHARRPTAWTDRRRLRVLWSVVHGGNMCRPLEHVVVCCNALFCNAGQLCESKSGKLSMELDLFGESCTAHLHALVGGRYQ